MAQQLDVVAQIPRHPAGRLVDLESHRVKELLAPVVPAPFKRALGRSRERRYLRALPDRGAALFMDCEGCEVDLLRPAEVPSMAGWRIIVELHDFLRPGLGDEVLARFADTHEIEVIPERRGTVGVEHLDFLTARQRAVALNEFRPARMRWAHLRP